AAGLPPRWLYLGNLDTSGIEHPDQTSAIGAGALHCCQHSALGGSNDPPAAAVQPRGSGWEGAGVKHYSGAGRGDAHRVSSCVGISTDDVVVRLCHDSHSRVPPPGTLLPTWLSASAWMRVTPGQLS